MIDRINTDFKNTPGRREKNCFSPELHVAEPIEVSILTPYYNTKEFFFETFESLRNQSLQNWEWVIVDDGSTDPDAVARLQEVSGSDSRITVIRQENSGPSAARNRAFNSSRGRYVCLLDSDDMIEPTYLEKCVWFLESHKEFVFCNSYSVVFDEQEHLWTRGFERGVDFLKANSGPPISVLRRQAYSDCGGFDETIRFGHEDWDFWLAMAKAGHWGYTIPEYLQWYRKLGSGRFEQIMRSGQVNNQFEKFMARKYKGLEKRFPKPITPVPTPFDSIETDVLVNNPLAKNDKGRRIMFIVPWMVTGGADRVNLDLIEGMVANGHEVTVCATLHADHCWEHHFARFTPDIFILPDFLQRKDFARFLGYLIASRSIDSVVITGSTIGYQLLPYLSAVSPNTAFLDICHVEEPKWQNGGHPRFGVGYQDALDLNIVTTRHLSEWMVQRGADGKRIRVMYTGVRAPLAHSDNETIKSLNAHFQLEQNIPTIIFIGRLCEQKRPLLLANILGELNNAGVEYQALIIGTGELWEPLSSAIRRLNLENCVYLVGSLPHAQWLEILKVADVLLMPSEYEGISVALLESMAAGVVPVVARVGGQDEIISDAVGYLIPQCDDELQLYVGALREILTNKQLRSAKSEECHQLMQGSYSLATTIRRFEEILDEAHAMKGARVCRFSLSMARELVTQAIENQRGNDALQQFWHGSVDGQSGGPNAMHLRGKPMLLKLAYRFAGTPLGQKFVKNHRIRKAGKAVISRLKSIT